MNTKFKKGQWITDKILNSTGCIIGIDNNRYEIELTDGSKAFPNIDYIDSRNFHLWTIEDAKPGDIIISKCKYNKDIWVSIFSHLDVEQKVVWSYCGGCLSDGYFDKESAYLKLVRFDFYPATSEQKNILWQKMREKGYKWNSRTKEVVKAPFKLEGTLFSAADKGIIDEIIFALRSLGAEKMISYDREIKFLERIRKL